MNKSRIKKRVLFLFVLVFLVFSSIWVYQKFWRKSYCIPVRVEGYTSSSIPYFKVNIEGNDYFFILDLGFSGEASIASGCLPEINHKTHLKSSTTTGFKGNEYQTNIYKIPAIKIDKMKFLPVMLEEEDQLFHVDSAITPKVKSSAQITSGALGSKLFKETNLCLDLHFSMIAFCDSFETFMKELQPQPTFSKVPILDENNLVEFEMRTPEGILRCLLDSGSTSNHINMPNPENVPIEEFIKKEKHFDNVSIGGKDFGPMTFLPLPINFPFHVDAIVGLDFLFDHVVFIDFVNCEIYFDKSTYLKSSPPQMERALVK